MEYVDIENLSVRETFYITHLLPYYNILKQGYSSLGYKHIEATKQLLYELAKNKVHSEKTKYLISKALVGVALTLVPGWGQGLRSNNIFSLL